MALTFPTLEPFKKIIEQESSRSRKGKEKAEIDNSDEDSDFEWKGENSVEFDVLKWEIKDGGSLENKQAGWLGSGQTTRPVTNSTG